MLSGSPCPQQNELFSVNGADIMIISHAAERRCLHLGGGFHHDVVSCENKVMGCFKNYKNK